MIGYTGLCTHDASTSTIQPNCVMRMDILSVFLNYYRH
jgi:hypothetical protein